MKKLLLMSLLVSGLAQADEVLEQTELYMALHPSIGGYTTLTEEPCDIAKVASQYVFKAKIETNLGTRRACWNTPIIPTEQLGKVLPMVHIVEEEVLEDETYLYHISLISRNYFKRTK